jgi:hypothetical protein
MTLTCTTSPGRCANNERMYASSIQGSTSPNHKVLGSSPLGIGETDKDVEEICIIIRTTTTTTITREREVARARRQQEQQQRDNKYTTITQGDQ